VLAVPLRAHGWVTGVLSVEHQAARAFADSEVALLQAFADQGALALQNARHFAESERRRKAAEALAEMARLLSQSLDPDDVGARIVESVRAHFGALHAVFYRLDPRSGDLVAVAFTGEMGPGYTRADFLPRGTGVAGLAVREARPVASPDVLTDARVLLAPNDRARVEQAAFRAVLAVPLVVQDRVIGALTVADRAGRTFTDEEIELAQAIGQQAALALENARLYADSEHRRREAEALTQLTQALTGSLDVRTVAQQVVDRVQLMFGSRLTGLRLLQPDGSLRAVASAGVARHLFPPGHVQPPGVGLIGRVVAAGRPAWTPDLLSEPAIVVTEDLRARLADDTRALLVAPLKTEGETIGVLVIADRTGRTFTDGEIGFLRAVADQAALALQNARSHEAAVRRGQELAALLRAARTVMAGLDLDTTLQRIVEEAARIAGTPHVKLLLVEAAAGELRVGAIAGSPVPPDFRVPMGTSYSGTVASTGRPLYVADTQNDPDNLLAARDREQGIRTYLGLPVRFGDEVLGVLTFNTTQPYEYGGGELAYLASFADQVALAVRNARLLQEARVRQARLEALLEISRELSRIQSVEPLLDRIAEACGQLLGTESVGFRLLEGDELVVSGAAGNARETMVTPRLTVGRSLSGLVAQTGEPLVVADLDHDPRVLPEHRAAVAKAGHRAWLGVPVKAGDRILGVLSVRTPRPAGFSTEDVRLAGAFASQAATALENARLYQQSQRAYEELARAQDQLVQAEKMQAVGRLAGGVAHDFNNLLTVIIGRSQMLLRRLPPNDPLRRYAVLIHQTGERAAALTQQLLAFSRRQVLQPSVLDLNDVVAGMDKMLRRLIGEDLELVTQLGIGLGRIKADQAQLEQVLMNLVVNARDAMPRGGRLIIATGNVEVDADALRSRPAAAPGRYVSLAVTDTGTGMDAETRARVFEPFFTTKGPGKGTGLGLATVFGVVRQSDGYVWVESEPGRGSTFTIHLPRVDEPVDVARPAVGGQRVARGSETVLLVEDEGELRDLTGEILEALGYRILKAGDGKEALAVAARHAGRIELLLTDVVMPQMSGRELASRLAESQPDVRILYMSGYTDEAISHHGVLDPGTALLQKPFSAEALARKIREVLDGGRPAAPSGPEGAADDQPARSPA
ncbi:MAG: GAF domain-containing protein, partial [Candidatus Rokuibacteriota bacterium]